MLGRDVTIFGDGKQVRDVLHVDDLLRAYEAAIRAPDKVAQQAFNIGGGPAHVLSLLDLIEMLEARLDRKMTLRWGDWRPGDQQVYVSDIRKLEAALGWKPEIGVAGGSGAAHGLGRPEPPRLLRNQNVMPTPFSARAQPVAGDTMIDRKTILVTGGAGFLGSHLCERLLARRAHTSSASTTSSRGRKENIEHLMGHPRFELLRHDVTFPLYVEVDEIYNLACPASPIHYQHDPVQTTKTNVLGAINMLGLAKRLKCRIFQASTSEVYGDPAVHPQREDYWGNVNPIGPRSCYDEGKRCAETLFFDYHRQHGARDQGRAHLQHLRAAHAPATTAAWCRTSSSRR